MTDYHTGPNDCPYLYDKLGEPTCMRNGEKCTIGGDKNKWLVCKVYCSSMEQPVFTAYIGGQVQDGEKREITLEDLMDYVKQGCGFWAHIPDQRYVPVFETLEDVIKALKSGQDVEMKWGTTDEKWLIKGKKRPCFFCCGTIKEYVSAE